MGRKLLLAACELRNCIASSDSGEDFGRVPRIRTLCLPAKQFWVHLLKRKRFEISQNWSWNKVKRTFEVFVANQMITKEKQKKNITKVKFIRSWKLLEILLFCCSQLHRFVTRHYLPAFLADNRLCSLLGGSDCCCCSFFFESKIHCSSTAAKSVQLLCNA